MKKFLLLLWFILSISSPLICYAASGDTIVHRTKTGYAYHNGDCSHLRSDIEITLREAYEDGLSPCDDCSPPELSEAEKAAITAANKKATSSTASAKLSGTVNTKTSNETPAAQSASSYTQMFLLLGAVISTFIWVVAYNYKKDAFDREKEKCLATIAEYEDKISQLETEKNHLRDTNVKLQSYVQQIGPIVTHLQDEVELLKDGNRVAALLKELSVIPETVKFTSDGLPYDAATNGKYGSFTAYVAYTGNKYHKKKGCSGANVEVHIINAVNQYRTPCQNCCKDSYKIPGWYKAYKTLLDLLK